MEKLHSIILKIDSTHDYHVSFLEKVYYSIDIGDIDENQHNTIDFEIVSTKGLFVCMRYGEIPRFILNDYVFPDCKLSDGTHLYTRTCRIRDLKKGRWYIGIRGANLISQSKYSIYIKARKEVYPEKNESNESLTTSIFNFFDSIFNPTHENADTNDCSSCKHYQPIPNPQNDPNVNIANNNNNNDNVHIVSNNNAENNLLNENNRTSVDMGDWIIVNDESSPAGRKGKAELLVDFPEEMTLNSSPQRSSLEVDQQRKSNRLSCNPPRQFICPITRQLMKQPVVASDGHSYEYLAISKWLEGFIRSPMTGQEMPSKVIIPNFSLKSLIDEWLSAHPYYED